LQHRDVAHYQVVLARKPSNLVRVFMRAVFVATRINSRNEQLKTTFSVTIIRKVSRIRHSKWFLEINRKTYY